MAIPTHRPNIYEALWIGSDQPNQLRHFGTKVQDDPTSGRLLSIITKDNSFSMEVMMDGTVIYSLTTAPFEHELHNCPHVDLSLAHTWDPHQMSFPKAKRSLGEEVGSLRLPQRSFI